MTKTEAVAIRELVKLAQGAVSGLIEEGPEALNPHGVTWETGLRNMIQAIWDFSLETTRSGSGL